MEKIFSEIDVQQIVKRGNSLEKIMQQLHYFKNGIPTINLIKIASINDGIFQYSEKEISEYCNFFDTYKDNYSIEKFVPASGAATRMFKSLNEFINVLTSASTQALKGGKMLFCKVASLISTEL